MIFIGNPHKLLLTLFWAFAIVASASAAGAVEEG
jgi:hypothetical protein